MTTDRELLEWAAKAAGMTIGPGIGELVWWNEMDTFQRRNANGTSTWWNPLTDDGDALRLAVKLELSVRFYGNCVNVAGALSDYREFYVDHGMDRAATLRRAIVRAAAAIGSQQHD